MSFSYGGDLVGSDIDWIRFTAGDTNATDARLTDEEITALVTLWGTKEVAAKYAMLRIATYYAEQVSHTIGATKVDYQKVFDNYWQRYKEYESTLKRITTGIPAPQAGENIFSVGMDDWRDDNGLTDT